MDRTLAAHARGDKPFVKATRGPARGLDKSSRQSGASGRLLTRHTAPSRRITRNPPVGFTAARRPSTQLATPAPLRHPAHVGGLVADANPSLLASKPPASSMFISGGRQQRGDRASAYPQQISATTTGRLNSANFRACLLLRMPDQHATRASALDLSGSPAVRPLALASAAATVFAWRVNLAPDAGHSAPSWRLGFHRLTPALPLPFALRFSPPTTAPERVPDWHRRRAPSLVAAS